MIEISAISEIIATYRKHGWILRRVLLSTTLRKRLSTDGYSNFDDIKIIDSPIDAAWFSRPAAKGPVAWEIRHLGNLPFALLENLDEADSGFEAGLREVESRLDQTIRGRKSA